MPDVGGITESLWTIKHKDNNETYNRWTDSLEAIRDAIAGFDPSWVAMQMLIDADDFDVADADADTERWTPEYITGADQGAADINTTTSDQLYMKIDSTGTGAREYAVARELPLGTRYFSVYADADFTWGTVTGTAMRGGIMISRGSTYDANNYIRVYKEKSSTVERISYSYNFGGAGDVAAAIVSTTDDEIAFKIDRVGTVFRIYYSLTQGGDATWVLGAQVEDTADNIDDNPSFYFNIYTVGSAVTEDIQVDFDTWRLGNTFGAFVDTIVSGFDSTDVSANIDGAVLERLESLQAALSVGAAASGEFEEDGSPDLWDALVADSSSDANITTTTGDRDGAIIERLAAIIAALNITDSGAGSGLEEDGTANLVDALGTDAVTVTDSATSVLGATGANNANNAFDSSSVVSNADGSVLERLEDLLDQIPTSGDVVVYLAAEDLGTTEISDDGTDPALLGEVSQTNKTEAEGIATPAWTEDYDLEQQGTMNLLSIFFALRWQSKFTVGAGAGTTVYSKWQMSNDAGSTWVDVTDNVSTTSATYVDHQRVGEGLFFSTITGGANQFQMRLASWTDDAGGVSSVETKIRSSSYVRLSYRKS